MASGEACRITIGPHSLWGEIRYGWLVASPVPDSAEWMLTFKKNLVGMDSQSEKIAGRVPYSRFPVSMKQFRRGELRPAHAAQVPGSRCAIADLH